MRRIKQVGKGKPDNLALIAGHAVVGVAAAYATAKIVKAIGPSIFLGIVAVMLHAELDAPVAQVLSEAGL